MTRAEVRERRQRVVRAVAALEGPLAAFGVLPYHVRWFGIGECVDAPETTIRRDLAWLEAQGFVRDTAYPARPARWAVTDLGRRWAS